MRHAFFAALALVLTTSALASEPGQFLDCSDWVFLEPGLSARDLSSLPGSLQAGWDQVTTERTTIDAAGRRLKAYRFEGDPVYCPGEGEMASRIQITALDGDTEHIVAYIPPRCGPGWGYVQFTFNDHSVYGWGPSMCPEYGDNMSMPLMWSSCVAFNPTKGKLYVTLWSIRAAPPEPTQHLRFTCEISGFATQADVLQTYSPQPGQLAFRVPYMPEGMPAADHFDTYWGNLTRPIDFTQAHGLQCDYPAAQPHVGDYLTVPDTLPTPAPGHGYYYVTAATYQGQTRYGRKTSGGRMSGRDPAVLPACASMSGGSAHSQ